MQLRPRLFHRTRDGVVLHLRIVRVAESGPALGLRLRQAARLALVSQPLPKRLRVHAHRCTGIHVLTPDATTCNLRVCSGMHERKTLVDSKTSEIKERYIFRIEPSLIQ